MEQIRWLIIVKTPIQVKCYNDCDPAQMERDFLYIYKANMKIIVELLRQPYPYYYQQKDLLRIVLLVGLIGFGFIYLFEPFNVEVREHRINYFWISFFHVLLSSLIIYSMFSVMNLMKIKEEKWTLGREIFALCLVLVAVGIGSFLIRDLLYDNPYNWSLKYLLEEVRNTFLVGLLLIFILVPLNFSRIYKKNVDKAAAIAPELGAPTQHRIQEPVQIRAIVKSDSFILDLEDFLFAKAEGNYLEFYFAGGAKELKRLTMKELETQLQDYPWIIKTHRSFLINTRKITKVAGNAQGYQLSLLNSPHCVPVSRGMIPAFNRAVGQHSL